MRVLSFAALVVTALIVQVSVVNLLPLPVARPDLLVVVVAACALVSGPAGGAVTGFAVGLFADVTPPADHTLGRLALCYALVGYAVGMLDDLEERSVVASMAVVAVAAAVSTALYALVGALVGDVRISMTTLAHQLPVAVAYDVLLAPFILPLVAAIDRRSQPERGYG